MGLLILLNLCVVAGFYVGWKYGIVDEAEDTKVVSTNWYTLAYYLFPPFWWPCFAMGVAGAMLFDAYRPYRTHSALWWGYCCDLISFGLLAQTACTVIFSSCLFKRGARCAADDNGIDTIGLSARLGVAEEDELGVRAMAAIMSRFYAPVMTLWLYSMAVGRGFTCRLFSLPIFVNVLGPASYNMYLFHQWVGQMYYLATRYEWWSYWRFRKQFYWFSPQPVPTSWQEYFFVVILTTWLSMLMNRIDPWLVSKWGSLWQLVFGSARGKEDKPTLDLVLDEIEHITGMPVEHEWTLAECGLASIAAPVLIDRLTAVLPGVSLSPTDLLMVENIEALADLLDKRAKEDEK